ncbi:peptidylprolyl isomerase [Scytonema sp. UIC 10036]|uniref:peptidylprolyl isomerase n=1 Tax=Scytonema sp. UIC 10036 TaxID=2304196 RepID=UPI0012DAE5E7|nr:peptidylprolyl isomerase [Scytonema sp. UIC 10036]MUG96054.1 peptidylprolyl isomerase [Scytonema sp. UIC 10036]
MSYSNDSSVINFFGLSIEQREIVAYLRKNFNLKEACQNIIYHKIIQQTSREQGIIVTPVEIQVELNRLLREKHLESSTNVVDWLAENMLTVKDWESAIQEDLIEQKLAEILFSQEIEFFFSQHQADFDQILLYQLIVPYEQLAHELFYQISEQEISLYEAAHLYDIDEKRRNCCGYEGKIYRYNLIPELANLVFNANLGELIGPVKTHQGSHLLMIEEFIRSELTTTIRQHILNQIMTQWLESKLNNMLQHNSSENSE